MYFKIRAIFILAAVCLCANVSMFGQCVLSIANLPDTIKVCKNTQVQLSPYIDTTLGSVVPTDTTWSPAAGLSNIHVLNPVATLTTTSAMYTLSISSISAQNYVLNGDFSQGNTGFTSSYLDTNGPGSLWPEGLYSITSNPQNVHPLFASFPAHSPTNMMVINGATSPVNIWCQNITVTPNTQYDFSAWAASASPSNPAQLQFEINSVLVGSQLNLPSTTGQWVEFHVVWNSGTNTSITICIHDQQTAAGGNDFCLDDITFREVCVASDSVYIHVDDIAPGITKVVKLGCQADTVFLTSLDTGLTAPNHYKWQFGDNTLDTTANPTHVYTVQGLYTIRLDEYTNNNCGDSATTTVDTRHPLSVGFSVSQDTICAGESIQFTNSDAGTQTPLNFYWDFGDSTTGNTPNPSHTYSTAGTYTVTHVVTDNIPCSDTMKMNVVVESGPTLGLTASDSLICIGKEILFSGALFVGYDSVLWNFGDSTYRYNVNPVLHAYDRAGDFTASVKVTYSHCPPVINIVNVQVFGLPLVNLGPDTTFCPWSKPIQLINLAYDSMAVTYLWSTGDKTAGTYANQPGTYWLTATNAAGCSTTDSIDIFKSCYLDIPNAFSPNGDGVNDYFFPRQFLSRRLVKFHMEIFDRWGQSLFVTDNIDGRGWDGNYNNKPQPEGVYIYMIDATLDGMAEEKVQGNVTLLR